MTRLEIIGLLILDIIVVIVGVKLLENKHDD